MRRLWKRYLRFIWVPRLYKMTRYRQLANIDLFDMVKIRNAMAHSRAVKCHEDILFPPLSQDGVRLRLHRRRLRYIYALWHFRRYGRIRGRLFGFLDA